MKYKVWGSSPLAGLAGLFGAVMAACNQLPQPLQEICIGIAFALELTFIAFVIRFTMSFRSLVFEEERLLFAKRTITAEDIEYVVMFSKRRTFLIRLKHRKQAFYIGFDRSVENDIRSELRRWARVNGIPIKNEAHQKVRRKEK